MGKSHKLQRPSIVQDSKLRVLLLPLEFSAWANASHWPYPMNFGFEEGFDANGVNILPFQQCTTYHPLHQHHGSAEHGNSALDKILSQGKITF